VVKPVAESDRGIVECRSFNSGRSGPPLPETRREWKNIRARARENVDERGRSRVKYSGLSDGGVPTEVPMAPMVFASRFLPFRGPRDSPCQCAGNFSAIYIRVCTCIRVCVCVFETRTWGANVVRAAE